MLQEVIISRTNSIKERSLHQVRGGSERVHVGGAVDLQVFHLCP